MPKAVKPKLSHGASDRAVSKNVKTLMHEGKKQRQAVAIALDMQRKAKQDKR